MATKNYINNKQLYRTIVLYKTKCLKCKEQDLPKPQIPRYVGECLLLLAERLSLKPTFLNFSRYRSDMVGKGIETCLKYFDNFDPEKSINPFAYFTQVMKFAFVHVLKEEKKQHYTKIKNMERLYNVDQLSEYDQLNTSQSQLDNDQTSSFVQSFEEGLAKKKAGIKSDNIWLKKRSDKVVVNTSVAVVENTLMVNTTIIVNGNNLSTNTIIILDL